MADGHKASWTIAPCFVVEDVVATADFYRDKLGFHYDRFWGNPPVFCMVGRGGTTIMLSQCRRGNHPNRLADPEGGPWDAYLWVDDADALFEEFQKKGVTILRGLSDRSYDMRDFDIEDSNGFRLCFGHNITPAR